MAESPVRRGDVVVDLGAGRGALTLPLARTGARVLAVELHAGRAAGLRTVVAGSRVAVVEVAIDAFRWPGHPFRVVANPPYDGVNALVRRLLREPHLLSADLVVAEGAARGLLRRAGGPAALEMGPRVPRSAFAHPPPGDACVLRIRRSGPAPRPGSRRRGRSRR
ncbi:rRNA adenine N-6-methyltransferase family protein [Nocardioides cynanchi]|uniref:rRNA adenine N-6-methyltransferase family protein n=1 Tax=Nocardioides cynanchi TaxID=2558918 RepID=UPI00192DF0FF|nr:rRNA adenine N-6-methyltransferase family protein [Nocardioides cynanchi]